MNSPQDRDAEMIRKNKRIGLIVIGTVAVMIILSFASAPLYSMFCRLTGFDGTPIRSGALPDHVLDRTVIIKFNADVDPHMPWDFKPEMREVTVHLGQKGLASYVAHNRASKAITGTALYNVTPDKAGKYFHKIQCFCFGEQTLKPGERVSMPVLFFVDPAMDQDPNMNDVKTITLSYTFYKAETQELDKAVQGFYNSAERAIPAAKN